MTKSEMVRRICKKRSELYSAKCAIVIDTLLEQMTEQLAKRGTIQIKGFGSLSVTHYNRVTGRSLEKFRIKNRKTGFKRVHFKVSKEIIRKLTNKTFNYIL